MKRWIWLCPAIALAAVGCGSGGGGNPLPSINSASAAAARGALATVQFRGLIGIANLGSLTQNSQDAVLSDPADPTNTTPLYVHVVKNPDNSADLTFFKDAAHTVPAGSAHANPPQIGLGGATDTITLTNVGSDNLSGTMAATLTSATSGTLGLNLTENVNGTPEAINGTLGLALSQAAGGPSGTVTTPGGPVAITSGGQTVDLQISSTNPLTLSPASNASGYALTGGLSASPIDSFHDTAVVQFYADGSSQVGVVAAGGQTPVVTLAVAPTGVVSVSTFKGNGSPLGTVTLGNIHTLNPQGISL